MVEHLKAHRLLVGIRSEFIFSRPDGSPLTNGDCKWPLRRALFAAGITRQEGRVGWHYLRHTFGSHLAMKGADALQIQQLMGHRSLATTMRYIHLAAELPVTLGPLAGSPNYGDAGVNITFGPPNQ